MSYSQEYLRESAEIFWASTFFRTLKMRNVARFAFCFARQSQWRVANSCYRNADP